MSFLECMKCNCCGWIYENAEDYTVRRLRRKGKSGQVVIEVKCNKCDRIFSI